MTTKANKQQAPDPVKQATYAKDNAERVQIISSHIWDSFLQQWPFSLRTAVLEALLSRTHDDAMRNGGLH